jgi:hypothetical protein
MGQKKMKNNKFNMRKHKVLEKKLGKIDINYDEVYKIINGNKDKTMSLISSVIKKYFYTMDFNK